MRITWVTTDGPGAVFHRLEFDAVTRERHVAEAELTEHVVETGESLVDHKRARPREYDLEAVVTNTPIGAPPASGFANVLVTAQASLETGLTEFSEEFDRLADVADTLERLRAEPIDLSVETRLRTYENFQVVRVEIVRDDPVDAMELSLTIREVFRGSATLVDAPAPREPRGETTRNGAGANQETAEQGTGPRDRSVSGAATRLGLATGFLRAQD